MFFNIWPRIIFLFHFFKVTSTFKEVLSLYFGRCYSVNIVLGKYENKIFNFSGQWDVMIYVHPKVIFNFVGPTTGLSYDEWSKPYDEVLV